MKMEALTTQGKRNELSLSEVDTQALTDEVIVNTSEDRARKLKRYIIS